jgi:hypothetical protein
MQLESKKVQMPEARKGDRRQGRLTHYLRNSFVFNPRRVELGHLQSDVVGRTASAIDRQGLLVFPRYMELVNVFQNENVLLCIVLLSGIVLKAHPHRFSSGSTTVPRPSNRCQIAVRSLDLIYNLVLAKIASEASRKRDKQTNQSRQL